MSASNKSWLMLGGLAIVVVGVIYATKRLKVGEAPPAEIAPTTLTSEANAPPPSRTHFPTILRAKPVTEAESTGSPRYAPRDASLPNDNLPFNPAPAGNYSLPIGPSTGPYSTEAHPVGAPSPAFTEPPVIDKANSPPEGLGSESAAAVEADLPTTYVTEANDSFWNISKQRYNGEGRFFKALYFHNRERVLRPDKIFAGIEIDTPPLAELKRMYPDLCRLGQRR